jgi:FdhD protein
LKENIEINLDSIQRNFYTTSSCGVCGKASIEAVFQQCDKSAKELFSISSSLLLTLPKTLQEHQQVFTYTGGLHGCALFNKEGVFLLSREDVGRHNALDKLIGAVIGSNKNQFKESILLLSGRASFELLQKAAMAGISLVASVGAPSSLALDLAKENDITLIGFLRDNRFNIYCGEKRIES